ncbi:hypothetical protein [Microseira wollei]|uniref:hypothetical protein n=1 Tax=Microseira wollei TaxID=467598 RepID=UPI001CFE3698|nr:hypothetical protein [Microseira wollei]
MINHLSLQAMILDFFPQTVRVVRLAIAFLRQKTFRKLSGLLRSRRLCVARIAP